MRVMVCFTRQLSWEIAASTNITGDDLLQRIAKNVDPGAVIYHDDYRPYGILDGAYSHESVNHSAGGYARGDVHTNSIEGEYSVLRPWLSVFRGVSKEEFFLYRSQYQFLRRTRTMDRVARTMAFFGLERRNVTELLDGSPPVVEPFPRCK